MQFRVTWPDNTSNGAFGWTFGAVVSGSMPELVAPSTMDWTTTVSREEAAPVLADDRSRNSMLAGEFEAANIVAEARLAGFLAGMLNAFNAQNPPAP